MTLSGHSVSVVAELLEHCEAFLRHASPNTHAELLGFLDQQPTRPDAGWLVDMLGFDPGAHPNSPSPPNPPSKPPPPKPPPAGSRL